MREKGENSVIDLSRKMVCNRVYHYGVYERVVEMNLMGVNILLNKDPVGNLKITYTYPLKHHKN